MAATTHPLYFTGDLTPPFRYAQARVPVRVAVDWPDGRATPCLGEAACWNTAAVYCRIRVPGETRARTGWFALGQVTRTQDHS